MNMETVTIAQLDEALAQCRREEYTVSIYLWSKSVNVSLNKRTHTTGAEVATKGEGPTFEVAFKAALANFPTNPLDGARWQTSRLAGPVTDVETTDVA